MAAFNAGLLVAAGVVLVGAVIAAIWLPARARREDIDAQQSVHDRQPKPSPVDGLAGVHAARDVR